MKKRHRLVRGFQNGKKDQEEERLRIGYPKSQKLAERAAVSIQNPAHFLSLSLPHPLFLPVSSTASPPESQTLVKPHRRREGSPASACFDDSSAMNNFHVYEAIGRGKHSVTLPHLPSPAPLPRDSVPLLPPGSRPGSTRIGAARVPAQEISDISVVFYGRFCDLVLVDVRSEDGV